MGRTSPQNAKRSRRLQSRNRKVAKKHVDCLFHILGALVFIRKMLESNSLCDRCFSIVLCNANRAGQTYLDAELTGLEESFLKFERRLFITAISQVISFSFSTRYPDFRSAVISFSSPVI
ncbi:MAG: hypothetical protein LBG58_01900 [Planctomycetaceae bacterium]|nr:hypothetical protein [Planctomycetaceae bacterium]